jgi:hypothetical protein
LTRATRLLSTERAPTVPHVIISPDTVSRDIPGRYTLEQLMLARALSTNRVHDLSIAEAARKERKEASGKIV